MFDTLYRNYMYLSEDPSEKETLKDFEVFYKSNKSKFKIAFYKEDLRTKKSFYYVIRIPSKVVKSKEYYYDVVIEIPITKTSNSNLYDNQFLVFSNSPSFSYTYAYVYNKYNKLITWLKGKYGEAFLNNSPKVKNPNESMELDKSLKYAILFLFKKYKYENMNNTRRRRMLFRQSINRRTIYNSINTAIQKTDESNDMRKKQRESDNRKKRIINTIKDPTTIFKDKKTSNTKNTTKKIPKKSPKKKITKKYSSRDNKKK